MVSPILALKKLLPKANVPPPPKIEWQSERLKRWWDREVEKIEAEVRKPPELDPDYLELVLPPDIFKLIRPVLFGHLDKPEKQDDNEEEIESVYDPNKEEEEEKGKEDPMKKREIADYGGRTLLKGKVDPIPKFYNAFHGFLEKLELQIARDKEANDVQEEEEDENLSHKKPSQQSGRMTGLFTLRELVEGEKLKEKAAEYTEKITAEFCDWLTSLGGAPIQLNQEMLAKLFEVGFDGPMPLSEDHIEEEVKKHREVLEEKRRQLLEDKDKILKESMNYLDRRKKERIQQKKEIKAKPRLPLHIRPPSTCKQRRRCTPKIETEDFASKEWSDVKNLSVMKGFCRFLEENPEVEPPILLKQMGIKVTQSKRSRNSSVINTNSVL